MRIRITADTLNFSIISKILCMIHSFETTYPNETLDTCESGKIMKICQISTIYAFQVHFQAFDLHDMMKILNNHTINYRFVSVQDFKRNESVVRFDSSQSATCCYSWRSLYRG